jgi:hypothetical protein
MRVLKIIFCLLLPTLLFAQSIQTTKESHQIDGIKAEGYEVILNGSGDVVKSSLARYLKNLGKTRMSGDYISISEPLIAGRKYDGLFYGSTKPVGNSTAAWIGIAATTSGGSALDRDIEKLVYDFGVTFRREQIQMQIDESARALQAVEKQKARLLNQNKDLNSKIENNKREKVQLEKAMVDNKLELEDLNNRLVLNAKAQDSVAVAAEQIRKVVEMHKDRQRKVK